jgi:hypothetical protein
MSTGQKKLEVVYYVGHTTGNVTQQGRSHRSIGHTVGKVTEDYRPQDMEGHTGV